MDMLNNIKYLWRSARKEIKSGQRDQIDWTVGRDKNQKRHQVEHNLPQSFGSARPPSSWGSSAVSGTSEERRQVLNEVRDIQTLCQTIEEHRVAMPAEHSQYKDKEPTLTPKRYKIVSGQNANEPEEEGQLSSHI